MSIFRRLLSLFDNAHWITCFKDGKAWVTKGKVSTKFVLECRDLLSAHSIQSGSISGIYKGGYVGLEFSKEIPAATHQTFRNIWGQYSNS